MINSIDNSVSNINNSFSEIIKKLEWIDTTSIANIVNSQEEVKEISNVINITLKDNKPNTTYLPLSDLEHRLRWKLDVFYTSQRFIKEDDGDNTEKISRVTSAKENLLDILNAYQNINTSILWLTSIDNVLNFIDKRTKKEGIDINIINNIAKDNFAIQCSDWVIESIIYEIFVNYRKYWKDWILNLSIENDAIIISLVNTKQTKENIYSSNNWLHILWQYLIEVWGSIDYDYSQDECVTTVTIPVKVDKD